MLRLYRFYSSVLTDRRYALGLLFFLMLALWSGFANEQNLPAQSPTYKAAQSDYSPLTKKKPGDHPLLASLEKKYRGKKPQKWGAYLPGILQKFPTQEKELALTLDACGHYGDGYDRSLVAFLLQHKVPATFFVSGRWIKKHREDVKKLAAIPFFDVQNHGTWHRPCSLNGRSIYGIRGTCSVREIIIEVEDNKKEIAALTGRTPLFFRSGTAYYDEHCIEIVQTLGSRIAGFAVVGDAGATLPAQTVAWKLLHAKPGSIIILHVNSPRSGTNAGVRYAVPRLLKQGYRFVLLKDIKEFY